MASKRFCARQERRWDSLLLCTNFEVKEDHWRLYVPDSSGVGQYCFWVRLDQLPTETKTVFLSVVVGDTIDIMYEIRKVVRYSRAYLLDISPCKKFFHSDFQHLKTKRYTPESKCHTTNLSPTVRYRSQTSTKSSTDEQLSLLTAQMTHLKLK